MIKHYGISNVYSVSSDIEKHTQNILRRGYTIIPNVLDKETVRVLCEKTEEIYLFQVKEFGENNLKAINEQDIVRCPLFYDKAFVDILKNEMILEILQKVFRNQFILHLQNVIINRPKQEHHQTAWHRDIPYQEYVTSNPIAINVFYCLSPFNEKTGATKILPYSHQKEKFPSIEFAEENAIFINADAGDVVMFDSWIYHRAHYNSSDIVRYGLNHVYTLPILKQQIDIPKFLSGKYSEDNLLARLLGYTFQTPTSVKEYRENRLNKIKSDKNEY